MDHHDERFRRHRQAAVEKWGEHEASHSIAGHFDRLYWDSKKAKAKLKKSEPRGSIVIIVPSLLGKSKGGLPKKFSVLTSDNPQHEVKTKKTLEQHLKDHQYTAVKVQIAHKLGQESVIHHDNGKNKLHFTGGEHKGKHHKGEGVKFFDKKPDDNFTTHEGRHFTLNLNWDKMHHDDDKIEKAEMSAEDHARAMAYHDHHATMATNEGHKMIGSDPVGAQKHFTRAAYHHARWRRHRQARNVGGGTTTAAAIAFNEEAEKLHWMNKSMSRDDHTKAAAHHLHQMESFLRLPQAEGSREGYDHHRKKYHRHMKVGRVDIDEMFRHLDRIHEMKKSEMSREDHLKAAARHYVHWMAGDELDAKDWNIHHMTRMDRHLAAAKFNHHDDEHRANFERHIQEAEKSKSFIAFKKADMSEEDHARAMAYHDFHATAATKDARTAHIKGDLKAQEEHEKRAQHHHDRWLRHHRTQRRGSDKFNQAFNETYEELSGIKFSKSKKGMSREEHMKAAAHHLHQASASAAEGAHTSCNMRCTNSIHDVFAHHWNKAQRHMNAIEFNYTRDWPDLNHHLGEYKKEMEKSMSRDDHVDAAAHHLKHFMRHVDEMGTREDTVNSADHDSHTEWINAIRSKHPDYETHQDAALHHQRRYRRHVEVASQNGETPIGEQELGRAMDRMSKGMSQEDHIEAAAHHWNMRQTFDQEVKKLLIRHGPDSAEAVPHRAAAEHHKDRMYRHYRLAGRPNFDDVRFKAQKIRSKMKKSEMSHDDHLDAAAHHWNMRHLVQWVGTDKEAAVAHHRDRYRRHLNAAISLVPEGERRDVSHYMIQVTRRVGLAMKRMKKSEMSKEDHLDAALHHYRQHRTHANKVPFVYIGENENAVASEHHRIKYERHMHAAVPDRSQHTWHGILGAHAIKRKREGRRDRDD
jgi:hypothetical protein